MSIIKYIYFLIFFYIFNTFSAFSAQLLSHKATYNLNIENIKENSFYKNEFSDNQYLNISESVNIYDTNWSWGANFSDYNHDGYEDLYIANGFAQDEKNEFWGCGLSIWK